MVASLLSISPKTVEAHTRNIMLKLGCNSRESIIDFVEKAGCFLELRKRYQILVTRGHFEQYLRRLSSFTSQKDCTCLVIDKRECIDDASIQQLKSHLELLGIKVLSTDGPCDYALYIGTHLSADPTPGFFFWDGAQDTYYFSFFEGIKKIFPETSVETICAEFQQEYELAYGAPEQITSGEQVTPLPLMPVQEDAKEKLKEKEPYLVISTILFILAVFSLVILLILNNPFSQVISSGGPVIRSNLLVPAETALLKRPTLLNQLKEKLKGQADIQVVALVGMGGLGKTTLARYFGQQQESGIVWEINAETKDSLINSFNDLAYTLAKTKEQTEKLDLIEKISSLNEKEKQIVSFVKDILKEKGNWFLIYDNVETFSDIKNCFPQDPKSWGTGKVIITTRDHNIKNISYIKSENVIYMEELSQTEALTLFSKIFYGCDPKKLTEEQAAKTLRFLYHIPPFPLDISVAAYYLKNTQSNYTQYLERIKHSSQYFESIQEVLLQENSDYTKTRYGIITSSLEKIMNINPEFKGLLLLICLLDSQNIAKRLLDLHANNPIIDAFIYNLRKYSLVAGEPSSITLSLHRSTQTIGHSFLLNLLTEGEINNWMDRVIKTLNRFYETYIEDQRDEIVELIPHLKILIKNFKEMKIPKESKNRYIRELYLLMGYAHKDCTRNLKLAKKYLTRAYELRHQGHPLADPALARLLKNLAECYIFFSSFDADDQSISYAQESLKICETLPHTEKLIAENLDIMGVAYLEKDNFEEARKCLNTALEKISSLPTNEKNSIAPRIYSTLGYIYSYTYLNRKEVAEAEKYVLKSLELLNASKLFSKASPAEYPKKLPCDITKSRMILGQIYSYTGRYEEAMDQVKEVEYINENHSSQQYFDPLLKARLLFFKGEILLRTGHLKAAEKELTECIRNVENLLGGSSTLKSRIHRAEIRVRQGRLKEAYEDCSFVIAQGQWIKNNYYNLLHLSCLYHAGVIKYKENDLVKSLEHFSAFFKGMQSFCKSFLDEKQYQELADKGAFNEVATHKSSSNHIASYLRRSVIIFSTIYGPAHSFVHDYVLENAPTLEEIQ